MMRLKCLKALDEGYSSKNYVRKFLRALHPKWRAKVTAIEESKNLAILSLDEIIGNLKVHEMIIKKDSNIVKGKSERVKSLELKAKKECSDKESSYVDSDDEEYALAVRNFKKFLRRRVRFARNEKKSSSKNQDDKKGKSDRKCFRCGDPNHLIGECPKPPRSNNQRAFVGGSWSDSGEEEEEKPNDETCLMAQASNEVHSDSSYYSDDNSSIDDNMLYEEYNKLCEFEKGTQVLNDMLENVLVNGNAGAGLGFDPNKASNSETKQVKFIKSGEADLADAGTTKFSGTVDPLPVKVRTGLPGATLIAPVVNYWWPNFPSNLSSQEYSKQFVRDKWSLCRKLVPYLRDGREASGSYILVWDQTGWLVCNRDKVRQQGEFESIQRDLNIGFGAWEFDPIDIENPFPNNEGSVHVWQGDQDILVPAALQHYIGQQLPWINYHELKDAGHMFPYADGMSDYPKSTFTW
ncbi:alpha/beta-Hydrolases superfamily protein [Artemisia annua]|uniref:Alpha/beta-Hydrolases superfamily protein n=1 Tax=Artemisia annua TaxID=35608 RepID=A0A2U1LTG9_ARTAN|nr:alpha/beta-Hydrolases superfamily protein [Artemisia annua]